MEQQNQQTQNVNPAESAPGSALTPEQIARAEAEAVAAMLRGEAPARPQMPAQPTAPAPEAASNVPDFVPYVDDVAPEPKPEAADADGEEDEEPYVPGAMEKRIDALPEKKWKLYQGIGGAVLGLVAMFSLTLFNGELSMYGLALAALLVLALPRYLERAWQHTMPFGRKVMLIAMIVGLIVMVAISGFRTGFIVTKTE